jgi:hypothetical protein
MKFHILCLTCLEHDVIRSKYGEGVIGKLDWGEDSHPWFFSLWWKDIGAIGFNLNTNWFSQSVNKVIGNGANKCFWTENWVGNSSIKVCFPQLYSISSQKEASVADLWSGAGGARWSLVWRRRLFVCEETLVEELFGVLQGAILSDQEDRWSWKHDVNGDFSMKSTYSLVFNLMAERESFSQDQATAFKAIWKCPAPSKVQGFSWMLLHDRIPSKVNLFRRNILHQVEDRVCVLCGNYDESVGTKEVLT